MIRGLFVSHAHGLSDAMGGLQICTQEYVGAIRAAGVALEIVTIEHDARLSARVRQRIVREPYDVQWRRAAVEVVAGAAIRAEATFIFLNLVNLAPMAIALRPRLTAGTRILLLSHGLESVDYLHTIPLESRSPRRERSLGHRLLEERAQRQFIDHVFCLSPWEADIERWLGASGVTAIPRTVLQRAPLAWHPDASRLGFVGTLDHRPTADGLNALLPELEKIAPSTLRVRVAGGPVAAGQALAARFGSVEYLGPLDNAALDQEAATWSAFLHPLFCYARGVSTKLAVGLAWQIPIVTTPAGARGYASRAGVLPTANSPASFARLALDMTDAACRLAARAEVARVAATSPALDEVGALIRDVLTTMTREGEPPA